jgi:hypothetical protein
MLFTYIWYFAYYWPGQQGFASDLLEEFANSTPPYLITDQTYAA